MGFPRKEVVFDVQSELGESAEFVYEFYITSKRTPQYKYRVFFLFYSAMLYPIGVSLDQSISEEINCDKCELRINDEEQFIDMLSKILQSERITSVISNLLRMNY